MLAVTLGWVLSFIYSEPKILKNKRAIDSIVDMDSSYQKKGMNFMKNSSDKIDSILKFLKEKK